MACPYLEIIGYDNALSIGVRNMPKQGDIYRVGRIKWEKVLENILGNCWEDRGELSKIMAFPRFQ
jgi:hypothetical protein